MSSWQIWLVIAVTAVGGFALRGVFILLPILPRRLPARLRLLLGLVPAAAFSALVAPSLVVSDGRLQLVSPSSLAGVVAVLVSLATKSLALSIVCGLAAYGLLDLVL
ncbi:AzlD domain-containing protein [Mycobacterium sp. NPDC003449]